MSANSINNIFNTQPDSTAPPGSSTSTHADPPNHWPESDQSKHKRKHSNMSHHPHRSPPEPPVWANKMSPDGADEHPTNAVNVGGTDEDSSEKEDMADTNGSLDPITGSSLGSSSRETVVAVAPLQFPHVHDPFYQREKNQALTRTPARQQGTSQDSKKNSHPTPSSTLNKAPPQLAKPMGEKKMESPEKKSFQESSLNLQTRLDQFSVQRIEELTDMFQTLLQDRKELEARWQGETSDDPSKPPIEVPPYAPTTVEKVLERHWNDVQRLAPDSGRRNSPFLKFLRDFKNINVKRIALDPSEYCPGVFPAACQQTDALRYHVGLQWVKEVTFVFTGKASGSEKFEQAAFRGVLSHLRLDGCSAKARDSVYRISLPRFSQDPTKFSALLVDCKNLKELTIGILPSDRHNLLPEAWAEKYGLDDLVNSSQLERLIIVMGAIQVEAPPEPARGKKGKAKLLPELAIGRRDVCKWFEDLGSHLKQMSTGNNDSLCIFLDLNDRWEHDEEIELEEVN